MRRRRHDEAHREAHVIDAGHSADAGHSVEVLGRYGDSGVLILTSLASGPKHGYALIKDIAEFAETRISPGTLYGALDRLAERGLVVRLPDEDRRHPYEITALGRAALRAYFSSLSQVTTELGIRLGVLGA